MRSVLTAIVIAGGIVFFGPARAWDGCGVGCHATASGACVVDAWGSARNECPAGSHPRPPYPRDNRFRHGTCMPF
ncbi:MAG: hypothetical protein JO141_15825 [Bradyrhizobium sp.]|nr:hypothetical protein [Bradyrhizobium sp.]